MRRRTLTTALTGLAVTGLLSAGGALADPTAPTFAEQKNFFHCAATKAGNVGAVSGGLPGWDTKAPTASVQSGAGCGSTNTPGVQGTNHGGLYDTVFAGTYTGNIKDITLELHSIYAGAARAQGVFGVGVEVGVDGRIFTVQATPAVVRATPTPSATRASEKVVFTLTGFDVVDDLDEDGAPDAGPGATEHQVTIKVRNGFIDQNPVGAFVYDTTEVPSGVTFNPATREAVVAAVA